MVAAILGKTGQEFRAENAVSVSEAPERTVSGGQRQPSGYQQLEFSSINAPKLTHYLFRFPAKFHPPVAHALIRNYTDTGQMVLDPFCGSGTLLLAAALDGRNSKGSDVDPLAVFIAKVKGHRLQPNRLQASWDMLRPLLEAAKRPASEYAALKFVDISLNNYEASLKHEQLWIPDIPNILHWFRRYVVVDLARILALIEAVDIPQTHRDFFRLMFAAIIRKASNADPVPVSALEVTAHMKRLDAEGRLIDPFEIYSRATEKGMRAMEEYWKAFTASARISVLYSDARSLTARVKAPVDAIITSPPYHNAVDYYRRHQLEMFWLGLTRSRFERLSLLPKYIGRARVNKSDPEQTRKGELGPLAAKWHSDICSLSTERAASFAHYVISMKDVFSQFEGIVKDGGPVVFVLGHSEWNGAKIPTSDLFIEMAGESFSLESRFWYPVKNRYMSYGRRNGADINKEYVLVFRRRNA